MSSDNDNLKQTFGNIADLYDAVRPGYPGGVITAILQRAGAERPLRIVEVGTGTGQATELFARLGYSILATDLSADLLAVARRRLAAFPNVEFAVGAFETLPLAEGAFDLLFSAQAFHWIDGAVGLPKAHRLLVPGGTLALFWNLIHYDATPLLQQLRDCYLRHVPAFAGWTDAGEDRRIAFTASWTEGLRDSALYTDITNALVPTVLQYRHERFEQLLRTFSWVQAQPTPVQDALLTDIRALLRRAPDPLELPVRTLLIMATRAGE